MIDDVVSQVFKVWNETLNLVHRAWFSHLSHHLQQSAVFNGQILAEEKILISLLYKIMFEHEAIWVFACNVAISVHMVYLICNVMFVFSFVFSGILTMYILLWKYWQLYLNFGQWRIVADRVFSNVFTNKRLVCLWVLMLLFQYVITILMDLILISFLWIAKSSVFLQVESKLGLHFPLLLYLLYVSVAVERSNEPSYRYAEYSFSGVVLMCPWWFKGIIEVLCELVHVEEGYQGQEGISGINVSDFFQHSEPFWSVAVYVIQNSFQGIFNYACGHFGMESEMRL